MADGSTLALKIATSTVADGIFVKIIIFHIDHSSKPRYYIKLNSLSFSFSFYNSLNISYHYI